VCIKGLGRTRKTSVLEHSSRNHPRRRCIKSYNRWHPRSGTKAGNSVPANAGVSQAMGGYAFALAVTKGGDCSVLTSSFRIFR
jgi:hypothetical protein